jgi:cytochrome c553
LKAAWLVKLTLLFGGGSLLLAQGQGASSDRGKKLFATCAACHGQNAEGNADPKIAAPAIAGLPEWYITAQLHKFRDGIRGQHPRDDAGNRMRPMAKTLKNKDNVDDLPLVSAYVASLTPPASKKGNSFPHADIEKGKALYAVCVSCHAADGKGNQALNAPGLTRLDDWYLLTQRKNYKNGVRGGDATKDPQGALMAPMAKTLADEQAMKDVIAYIKSL